MDDRGDPRLAWLEEQVHELVAPNGRRAPRARNRAHLPRQTALGEDDLRATQGVLGDVEAVLSVVGFLVGVSFAVPSLSLSHRAR